MPGARQLIVTGDQNAELGNVRSVDLEGLIAIVQNRPAAFPEPVNLTLTAEALAATSNTAVTLAVASVTLPIPIFEGQPLSFQTPSATYIAEVATTASGTITSLDVIIHEPIPDAAVAQFPPRIEKMTQFNGTSSTATSSEADFDGRGASINSTGETTRSFALNTNYNYYAVGAETIIAAQRLGRDVFIARVDPSPDEVIFSRGPIEWGVGVVTQGDRPASTGSSFTNTLAVTISGSLTKEPPVRV